MVSPSDGDLARRAQGGESEAFGELVRRYQTSVFNVCYRLLGERREAEDLTQESFIRAYQRIHLFDPDRAFGPWMRRVAANMCLNHLNVNSPTSFALDEERDEPSGVVAYEPEAILERTERYEAIREALSSLPTGYRAVIELRHFQGMSYAEISEFLEIPLSDVKSHLFRGRRMLAKRLKPDD